MSRPVYYSMIAALLVLASVLMPVPADASMCANCTGKPHILRIGSCGGCDAATSSAAFSLCPTCSAAQNRCESCGAALAPVAIAPDEKPVVSDEKPTPTPATPPSADENPEAQSATE